MARYDSRSRRRNRYGLLFVAISCFVLFLALFQLQLPLWINNDMPSHPVMMMKEQQPLVKENPTLVFVSAMVGPKYKDKAERRRPNLEKSASNMFLPKDIHFYTDFPNFILDNPIYKPHLEFLHNESSPTARGAGFWFWKPVMIHYHLEQMDYGDILFYADTDLVDVHFGWNEIKNVTQFLKTNSQNVALYYSTETERYWNKRDVYQHYCPDLDPNNDKSHSYAAGWHIIRKTPGVMKFYRDWKDGVSVIHHVDDSPSVLPNIKYFSEHRHDQSIMNLLLKCRYKEPHKLEYPTRLWMRVMTFQFPD